MYPIDKYILACESFATDCEKEYCDYQMARIIGGPAMEGIDVKATAKAAWEKIKGLLRKILSWIVGIPAKIHGGVNKLLTILGKSGNEGEGDPTKFQQAMQKLQNGMNKCAALQDLVAASTNAMNELRNKPDSDPTWITQKINEIKQKKAAAMGDSQGASESFTEYRRAIEADATATAAPKKKLNFGSLKNLLAQIGSRFQKIGSDAANGTKQAEATANTMSNQEGENASQKQSLLSTIGAALASVGREIARLWGEFSTLVSETVSGVLNKGPKSTTQDYDGPAPEATLLT